MTSHLPLQSRLPLSRIDKLWNRRAAAAALVALPVVWTNGGAQPAPQRRLTPSQTEGPFYPVKLPKDADFDLLRNGALTYNQGQPSWLEGTVSDVEGRPVSGAHVEIWQCDHAGHYDHPGDGGRIDKAFQGFGRVAVNAQGEYRFRTIRPVAYSGRAPHIHVKVKLADRELLTTQLYVAGDALNQRDFLWRSLADEPSRAALTVPFTPGPDGLRLQFALVVQA
jgi:protocatechuate 3,4-dioxygenase, beta subunit